VKTDNPAKNLHFTLTNLLIILDNRQFW